MKTRRQFLATTGSALACSAVARAAEKPLFSFGLMADCQYADAETRGTRFYRESPRKLGEAIEAMNRRDLAFSFHIGDFIDRDFRSFEVLQPVVERLQSKLYHALGNHDFDVADEFKAEVPGVLGLDRGYYSFRRHGFRFVVIDTTEVSVYRHPADSAPHRAAAKEMELLNAAGNAAAKPWNSRPGDAQVTWIEEELKAATAAGETVLILGHHPILPDGGHSIWKADVLDRILRAYPCAKLYLNGHNHAGHYLNAEGFHYLTLDGMLETETTNAFAYADLYSDRLEITGFERQESHVLVFR